MRKLAHQLIDVGYRALALRLHPDSRWIERGDDATEQGSRLIAGALARCPPVVAWTAQAADLTALLHSLLYISSSRRRLRMRRGA